MDAEFEPVLPTDPALEPIMAELVAREPIFHRPEWGTTRADYERMMVPDYWEVGASGRRYGRALVLDELDRRRENPGPDPWQTRGFHCRRLSADVFLLTYTLLQGARVTRRATIWRRNESGWQIVFHQGTLVESASV